MTKPIALIGAVLGAFACGVAAVHAVQAQVILLRTILKRSAAMLDSSSRIARIMRLASVVVLLTSAWPAQAALVFVQAPDGPPLTNATFAQVAGAHFEAVADLMGGRFGGRVEYSGVPPTTWFVRSGTLAPVQFTNIGATAISGTVFARATAPVRRDRLHHHGILR